MRRPILTIIVICGPPCSGKSDIARALVLRPEFASFARFEMDELRLTFWPFSHTAEDRANAYARMHELAAEALQNGAPGVVLVATYQPRRQRTAVRVLADRVAARLILFECSVSPDDAVSRFQGRSLDHAAIDLSAEKVWDLAQDFQYFPHATKLDSSLIRTPQLVEAVAKRLQDNLTTQILEDWVAYGNPGGAAPKPGDISTSELPPKLTPRSRRRARWRWFGGEVAIGASLVAALAALIVLAKAGLENVLLNALWFLRFLRQSGIPGLEMLIGFLRQLGFPGDPAEWVQAWLAFAVLASGFVAIYEYFRFSQRSVRVNLVRNAGRVPRLALREGSPLNLDIFRRYLRRSRPKVGKRMLIEGVPLWFLVPPQKNGFEVTERRMEEVPLDRRRLEERAADVGLDWSGYLKWRQQEKEDQYFNRYREVGVRALGFDWEKKLLTVCKGNFMSYVCTELSANLYTEGRFGFEMRQIFEGPAWTQSDSSHRRLLDLEDIGEASKTYEMLVGVQVGLTTHDGYLILQRRSGMVQSATGGVGSSGAGSAKWDDFRYGKQSITESALRETREEIGWIPHKDDDLTAPFLGAAFNLLRGRDLNFYCHFHTHWTLEEICAESTLWRQRVCRRIGNYLVRRRILRRVRPKGATLADDAWEVAHLIPVPVRAVLPDGTIQPPFSGLLGDARHVRGLLYCLARSEQFLKIQKHNGRPVNRTSDWTG